MPTLDAILAQRDAERRAQEDADARAAQARADAAGQAVPWKGGWLQPNPTPPPQTYVPYDAQKTPNTPPPPVATPPAAEPTWTPPPASAPAPPVYTAPAPYTPPPTYSAPAPAPSGGGGAPPPPAPAAPGPAAPPAPSGGGGGGGGPETPRYEQPSWLPPVDVSPTGAYISPARGVITEAQMRQELLAAGIPASALGNSAAILAAWQSVANPGDKVQRVANTVGTVNGQEVLGGGRGTLAEQNPNLIGGGTGADSGRTPGTMPGEGAGQSGGTPSQRAIVGADGNVYNVVMSDQEYAQAQADINQIQADARKAQEFQQGIQSGQLDIARATQAAAAAYQQALIDGKNRELAIQEAQIAMQRDFQEQTLQLQRMIAAANIRNQREATDLQRRALRSRNLASVRYV